MARDFDSGGGGFGGGGASFPDRSSGSRRRKKKDTKTRIVTRPARPATPAPVMASPAAPVFSAPDPVAMGGYTRGILPGSGMGLQPAPRFDTSRPASPDSSAVQEADLNFERRLQASPEGSPESMAPPWMKKGLIGAPTAHAASGAPAGSPSMFGGVGAASLGLAGVGPYAAGRRLLPKAPDIEAAHTPEDFPGSGLTGEKFQSAIEAARVVPAGKAAADKAERNEVTAAATPEVPFHRQPSVSMTSRDEATGYERTAEIGEPGGPLTVRETGPRPPRPKTMSAFGRTYTPVSTGGNFSAMGIKNEESAEREGNRQFNTQLRDKMRAAQLQALSRDPAEDRLKLAELQYGYRGAGAEASAAKKQEIETWLAANIERINADDNLTPEEKEEKKLEWQMLANRQHQIHDPKLGRLE